MGDQRVLCWDLRAVFVSVHLMKRAASASWGVPPSEAWDVPQAVIDYEDDDPVVPPGQHLVNELLDMYATGVLPATRLCSLCPWAMLAALFTKTSLRPCSAEALSSIGFRPFGSTVVQRPGTDALSRRRREGAGFDRDDAAPRKLTSGSRGPSRCCKFVERPDD